MAVARSPSGKVVIHYVLPVFIDGVTFTHNEPYGVSYVFLERREDNVIYGTTASNQSSARR